VDDYFSAVCGRPAAGERAPVGTPARRLFLTRRAAARENAQPPAGYRVPPHTHPAAERVTVLSGTFYIGMGEKFDEKAGKEMAAGAFGRWPAGMKHFAWAKGETVIQLHGTGPWSIEYVNSDADPRKEK
jgi:hypothetical protein